MQRHGITGLCIIGCVACSDVPLEGGAGGNAGASTTPTSTSSTSSSATGAGGGGPLPAADFETRCAADGVVRCVGFDEAADIVGQWGDPTGITAGDATPGLDTNVKASGASSLVFTVPSNSGSDSSGSYFANFSDDLSVQFGENEEFYVQWRQRFSPEFLATHFLDADGWKQAIITTGDQPAHTYASCEAIGVVMNNYGDMPNQFPILYNSCTGSTSHGPYDGFYEPIDGGNDFKLQNARPDPYCLYSQGHTSPQTYMPPDGNCVGPVAEEWMTFQIKIKTGPRNNDEFVDSFVSLWIARENAPSELVIEWGPYNLTAGDPAEDQRYGKVWLLPYNTVKNASQTHPTAYTWYDELIVSRAMIADPGGR